MVVHFFSLHRIFKNVFIKITTYILRGDVPVKHSIIISNGLNVPEHYVCVEYSIYVYANTACIRQIFYSKNLKIVNCQFGQSQYGKLSRNNRNHFF